MSTKIKVLQVTGAMNRGGAEVMLMDVTRNKSDRFHFDFLINYNQKKGIQKGDFDDELTSLGCGIHHIPAQWEIGPRAYARKFKALIDEIGFPDVVHIHMNAKSGIIAWAASRAGAKRIVVHSHADLKIRGHWLKVFLSKLELRFQKWLMARFATDFWGCSMEANASLFLPKILKTDHAAIIKNAVDVTRFQDVGPNDVGELKRSIGLPDDALILGNVGRLVRHKNVGFILDIVKELIADGVNAHLIYAGRIDDATYEQDLAHKVNELDIGAHIHYLGNRDDVPVIMHAMDVFVGPALQEGFGLVAVEAQACGTPCVLYTGFPPLVDMDLDLVQFIPNFEISTWKQYILNARKMNDLDAIKTKIEELGFDVRANTRTIEDYYQRS